MESVQDGAFAWLVCFACFFNLAMIGGFVYASGFFFILFKETFDATDSELTLISSINIGVMRLVCPFTGILCERFNTRSISIIGCVLSTIGIVTGAFASKVLHLQLGFGALAGLGLGITFNSSVSFINPYFNKYKRVASSLVMAGLGMGAILFPPVINFFHDLYGWRGAVLMIAGLNAHVLVSSSLLRPFYSKPNRDTFINDTPVTEIANNTYEKEVFLDQNRKSEIMSNEMEVKDKPSKCGEELRRMLSLVRNIPYMSAWLSTFLYTFSVIITVMHFGNYALTCGYNKVEVVSFYTVLGISNVISRPLSGFTAHWLKLNLALYIMIMLVAGGLLTVAVPFMNQKWMLYGFCFLQQLMLGPANSLMPTIIMEHVVENQVPSATGIYFASTMPGYSLGGVIAALIFEYTGGYAQVFCLSGSILIVGGLIMAPSSYYIYKEKKTKALSSSQ